MASNVTAMGMRAEKARETVGGTPSGILMVQSFSMTSLNSFTDRKPTTMAMKTPFAPIQPKGRLATR